jgi:diphthamide biosynthesis protein 7
LGVVNAEKTLEIYAFNPESTELEVVTRYTIEDDESERLLLSLDWSTGKYQSNEPEIVCSDSRGNIHRFKLENDKLAKCGSCHGHDFEAWIAGFYYWNPDITFSGGDDCCFLKFDKRVGLEPISRNRIHEAGVTSMHSRSSKEYVLATGR